MYDLSSVGIENKWGNKYAVCRKRTQQYIEVIEKPKYHGIPYCKNCCKNRTPDMIRCPECNQQLRWRGNRRKHLEFPRN